VKFGNRFLNKFAVKTLNNFHLISIMSLYSYLVKLEMLIEMLNGVANFARIPRVL